MTMIQYVCNLEKIYVIIVCFKIVKHLHANTYTRSEEILNLYKTKGNPLIYKQKAILQNK